MLDPQQQNRIAPKILTIQIVSFAILAGAVMASLVISSIVDWEQVTQGVSLLTLLGAVTGVGMLCMAFVVPKIASSSSAQSIAVSLKRNGQTVLDNRAVDEVIASLTTSQLIFSAMVEGVVFLNLVVFVLEKSVLSLVVIGIALALLMVTIPLKPRIYNKLENRLGRIEDEMKYIE